MPTVQTLQSKVQFLTPQRLRVTFFAVSSGRSVDNFSSRYPLCCPLTLPASSAQADAREDDNPPVVSCPVPPFELLELLSNTVMDIDTELRELDANFLYTTGHCHVLYAPADKRRVKVCLP